MENEEEENWRRERYLSQDQPQPAQPQMTEDELAARHLQTLYNNAQAAQTAGKKRNRCSKSAKSDEPRNKMHNTGRNMHIANNAGEDYLMSMPGPSSGVPVERGIQIPRAYSRPGPSSGLPVERGMQIPHTYTRPGPSSGVPVERGMQIPYVYIKSEPSSGVPSERDMQISYSFPKAGPSSGVLAERGMQIPHTHPNPYLMPTADHLIPAPRKPMLNPVNPMPIFEHSTPAPKNCLPIPRNLISVPKNTMPVPHHFATYPLNTIPGPQNVIPTSDSYMPYHQYSMRIPHNRMRIPNNQGQVQFENVRMPSNQERIPHEHMRMPNNQIQVPYEKVRIPNNQIQVPYEKVRIPNNQMQVPSYEQMSVPPSFLPNMTTSENFLPRATPNNVGHFPKYQRPAPGFSPYPDRESVIKYIQNDEQPNLIPNFVQTQTSVIPRPFQFSSSDPFINTEQIRRGLQYNQPRRMEFEHRAINFHDSKQDHKFDQTAPLDLSMKKPKLEIIPPKTERDSFENNEDTNRNTENLPSPRNGAVCSKQQTVKQPDNQTFLSNDNVRTVLPETVVSTPQIVPFDNTQIVNNTNSETLPSAPNIDVNAQLSLGENIEDLIREVQNLLDDGEATAVLHHFFL